MDMDIDISKQGYNSPFSRILDADRVKFKEWIVILGNPGPSGIGGIFRDEEGKFIAMFSGPVGGDSLRAEVLEVMEGMQRAKLMNIQKLIVEGDSKLVISWLQDGGLKLWLFNNERKKIRWLTRVMEIIVGWVKRSANSVADALAKQGAERDSLFWAQL